MLISYAIPRVTPGGVGIVMSGKHHQAPWWRCWWERGQIRRGQVKWMVDGEGNQHLVAHRALREGPREGKGFYLAVCGQSITGDSITTLPRFHCPDCAI